MPPFAGQGMCAGIRDAANLAWKLDLVLKGHAPDALLDTYQLERLPNARQAIEFSMQLGNVICVPDPIAAAARDEAMAAAVGTEPVIAADLPGLDSGIVHATSPHAGRLFVQGDIDRQPFDDVHGAGWRLITIDPDTSFDDDLVAWFSGHQRHPACSDERDIPLRAEVDQVSYCVAVVLEGLLEHRVQALDHRHGSVLEDLDLAREVVRGDIVDVVP